MFSEALIGAADELLSELRQHQEKLATAESCTGGLIAALVTEFHGASDVFERAFVTYSNAAKTEMLGVERALIERCGVVSREVAIAMAEGALLHSRASIAVAVTGIAGPGGGSAAKPVGLVHVAVCRNGVPPLHQECRFGEIGRDKVRQAAVMTALALARRVLQTRTNE